MYTRKIAVIFVLCSLSLWAQPPHEVTLTLPNYGEEATTWCGPATAQMIMEAYPSGGCSILQEDIWEAIQLNKVETMWDSDPAGLRHAMIDLCPPTFTWSIFAYPDTQQIMYAIAYYMTRYNYPVACLLNTQSHNGSTAHEEHWVAIKGFGTDVDPTTSSTVKLEYVCFNDPAVDIGDPAVERYLSGGMWYNEFKPVTKLGSSYFDDYVAIIEPPEVKGRAIAPAEIMHGALIDAKQARKLAKKWIRELKLDEYESYSILKEAKPLAPLLVNQNFGAYYIVPFAVNKKNKMAEAAVLVNAYEGNFQEVGAFKATKYMSQKVAIKLATHYFGIPSTEPVEAELVHLTEKRITSRYFPLWRIKAGNEQVLINKSGKILRRSPLEAVGCIDFEDVPLRRYISGTSFLASDVRVSVSRCARWGAGLGEVHVGTRGRAGGSGNEIFLAVANVDFDFGVPIKKLDLRFYDSGGDNQIRINGHAPLPPLDPFDDFSQIRGLIIGGVHVAVRNGGENEQGQLTLEGEIRSFSICGQELFIDDVCWER